jgi:rhamnogalacturonyl hydrolase YesR
MIFSILVAAVSLTAHSQDAFERATDSAAIAGHALGKVHRWLHEVALTKIDPETGLYKADGKWNYRDTAADCYPFFIWAAHVVDRQVLNGAARQVLDREIALCNVDGAIPVPWDFETGAPAKDMEWDEIVFQASEYVKDGLIAIVEVTGQDEWFERMRAIEDALWETAKYDTPFGKIPSTNIEVNGEQLQALARLYSMTGEEKYLDWADRLADYYFADENFVVTRLRDHGCEIIGGLGLLHAVESTHRPDRAKEYAPHLKRVYDRILAEGCNEDGMMYDELGKKEGRLSDGWGYNYVGYLCYDLATGADTYRKVVADTLKNTMKPAYENYPWEGESIDGYADSIEGALYLLNRVPVAEGFAWVDRETKNNLVDHPSRLENGELWGTMKLQANGVRTVLMHSLMHTQGLIARPWQQGLELGAAPEGEGIVIVLRAPEAYSGALEFDLPRHRVYLGFEQDWPRMNTLPEWFTVEPEASYTVRRGEEAPRVYTGRQLHAGLDLSLEAGALLRIDVSPVK